MTIPYVYAWHQHKHWSSSLLMMIKNSMANKQNLVTSHYGYGNQFWLSLLIQYICLCRCLYKHRTNNDDDRVFSFLFFWDWSFTYQVFLLLVKWISFFLVIFFWENHNHHHHHSIGQIVYSSWCYLQYIFTSPCIFYSIILIVWPAKKNSNNNTVIINWVNNL